MDKILDKIIKQVIVEASTRKQLAKHVDSDTILNKLIKQVITEAGQRVEISKLDKKVAAIVTNYGFGFKISANYPITLDQVRDTIQANTYVGTNSRYNSYLNYTYFVGSNMHKNPEKKFVANVVIINAKRMLTFNSTQFKNAVDQLLNTKTQLPATDVMLDPVDVTAVSINTVGQKDGALEAKHHKSRGSEAMYMSTVDHKYNKNKGSTLIFIDNNPTYATLPTDLMTVLTKKGAALMSTSGNEVPGFMQDPDSSLTAANKQQPETAANKQQPETAANKEQPETAANKEQPETVTGKEQPETATSIKKQTFTRGMKDNADLKTLQDEIKKNLKTGDQSVIQSVPVFVEFMNVDNMTGNYGSITSKVIAKLKRVYKYGNTDGDTIEPDFLKILLDKMQSTISLTEQFVFSDSERELLNIKTVDTKPVDTKTVDTKTVNTKTVDTKTVEPKNIKNLDQIPLGSNNWRSAQPTSTQLAKFISEKGIKSVIRFNGNGVDTDNNFSIDDEKAVSVANGAEFYKLSSTRDQLAVNNLLTAGNVLIHCHHGADRTGGNIGGWLYSNNWGDTKKIWDYTTKYNGWNRMVLNSPNSFSRGGYLYQATKFGVKDIKHAQSLAKGDKSINNNTIKPGGNQTVALQKSYKLCLDAAADLIKITTTNPQKYWKPYLRWDGLLYRPNANKNGIAWFKSAWDKAWGTKLAAASKIRSTVNQKNINELIRRKNDIIEMIRKGGSMTVTLRIQNPFTGEPTDFNIKWNYLSGIQNTIVKRNPKKTNKRAGIYNRNRGGNLGR